MEASINGSEDLKALSLFLTTNPVSHIRNSQSQNSDTLLYLSEYLRDNVNIAESLDFNIEQYGASRSFDQADWRFDNLIAPYLKEFTFEQMKKVLIYSNDNGQIYGRRKADTSNRIIKNRILTLDDTFNFKPYV